MSGGIWRCSEACFRLNGPKVLYLQPAPLGDALTSRLFTGSTETGDTPDGPLVFTCVLSRAIYFAPPFSFQVINICGEFTGPGWGKTHATQTIRATAKSLVCRGCMVKHASLGAAYIHSLCLTHCRAIKQTSTVLSVI